MFERDSIITPTRNVVTFCDDAFLLEAVCEDDELHHLVPRIDEMFDDMSPMSQCRTGADRLGQDDPEWDDPDHSKAGRRARLARVQLIDSGCILAESDPDEAAIYFTGLARALKGAFDFCVEFAGNSEPVFNIITSSPVAEPSSTRNWRIRDPADCCRNGNDARARNQWLRPAGSKDVQLASLARKLHEAEALTAVAVYFLNARPKDVDAAVKAAIHEIAGIDNLSTRADAPLKDWLCSFANGEHAIQTVDSFSDLGPSDLMELEEESRTSHMPAAIFAVRRWILAFVEAHGGRENVKSQILRLRPTVGMDLLRKIDNKSLLTWALRRLSELVKES